MQILTEDQTGGFCSLVKVLCCDCWTHINDFHDFQRNILRTRTLMKSRISKLVSEIVELPVDGKALRSDDEFSVEEQFSCMSDFDDVPLNELREKENKSRVKTRAKTYKEGTCNDLEMPTCDKSVTDIPKNSLEFDEIKGNYSVRMSPIHDEKFSTDLQPKKELLENESEINLQPLLETCAGSTETQSNIVNCELIEPGTRKKARRGRKPKNLTQSESSVSTKISCGLLRANKSEHPVPKTKDQSKTKYMEKCKENDSFIAQWKPSLDCDLCSASAPNFDALRSHFREVHKTKCYIKCCDRKFYRRYVLMGHIRLHVDPETHKCDICGKSSTTKYNLKLHKNIVHGALRQFECEICHRQFNQKPTLDRHLLTHVQGDKKFFCNECGKGYVLEIQLNSHIKTVHGVDCVCDQCGRTFRGANSLKKHLLDHSGVPKQKLPCDICGAELTNKNGLRRHKAAYHHDGTTAYVCSICGKVASSENALKSHKKQVHEEKRKFKCTYCDKAFKRPKVLREHIATHTGVDLYQCPHCPQTFKVSANMHHHRKRAHPVEWEKARSNRLNLPKVNITEVTNQVVL